MNFGTASETVSDAAKLQVTRMLLLRYYQLLFPCLSLPALDFLSRNKTGSSYVNDSSSQHIATLWSKYQIQICSRCNINILTVRAQCSCKNWIKDESQGASCVPTYPVLKIAAVTSSKPMTSICNTVIVASRTSHGTLCHPRYMAYAQ